MQDIKYQTFSPTEKIPQNVIFPKQTHSDNIIEIISGKENLENCDGIWCYKKNAEKIGFKLGIKTADCAPIIFMDNEKFGIIHAGWRGLCGNIIENMLEIFSEKNLKIHTQNKNLKIKNKNLNVWIGPILPLFEIQKDFCYDLINAKFGEIFFEEKNKKIIFNFKGALSFLLIGAKFDKRNTLKDVNLASFRENKASERNILVVGNLEN